MRAKTKATAASPVAQPIVRATLALAGIAIVGAMVLSYSAQATLAAQCGLPELLAWVYPVVVDVPLLVATLALTAMHSYAWRARAMPMMSLLLYVGLSVWLNAMHAVYLGVAVPLWLRVTILAIPAVTLAVVVELSLVVSRRAEPRPARPIPLAASQPVPVLARATTLTTPAPARPATVRPAATRVGADRDAEADEVRALSLGGHSERQIAAQLSLSRSRVHRILTADHEGVLVPA